MNQQKPYLQKAWIRLGLLCVGVMVLAAPAMAQDSDASNRLRRLENEVQTLSRAIYKGETPPAGTFSGGSSAGAEMEVRLQQLENDIRELRGRVEEVSYENRQLRDDMERITSDMQLRLQDLEGGSAGASGMGGGASSGAGAGSGSDAGASSSGSSYYNAPNTMDTKSDQGADAGAASSGGGYQWGTNNSEALYNNSGNAGGVSSDTSAAPVDTTRQLGSYGETTGATTDQAANMYENAYSLIKNSQYDRAQGEFKTFMKQYPDHALAGNAQYWLGETYYVKGQYDEAARAFAEGYQKYPKNSKSADNLLKLGLSLDALGKKDDACIAFKQLNKENLSGSAPVMRRAEQEMSRLGC